MLTHIKTKGVIHHSAIAHDGKEQFSRILGSHLRRWAENGIAYTWIIEEDGELKKGRGEWSIGYHAGVWVENLISIGVCLAGDFTKHDATIAQYKTLSKLIVDIMVRWRISIHNWDLHKDIKPTACPGIDHLHKIFANGFYADAVDARLDQMSHALITAKGTRKKELERAIQWLQQNS